MQVCVGPLMCLVICICTCSVGGQGHALGQVPLSASILNEAKPAEGLLQTRGVAPPVLGPQWIKSLATTFFFLTNDRMTTTRMPFRGLFFSCLNTTASHATDMVPHLTCPFLHTTREHHPTRE